jgi:hypothetical protein
LSDNIQPTVDDLIKNFPFPTLREKQFYVLREIADASASGYKYIILEAPTGFGKSPVAIAAALTLGKGKSPVEVAIQLDLDAGRVRAMYYDYWELKGMYKLAEIYIELGREDLLSLVTLHKIFKHLGMKEHDMIKVLELAKHNQLERLQWKVQHLENQIFVLEDQKAKATNHLLVLNRRIDEFEGRLNMYESLWTQKTGEATYINQEPRMLQGPRSYNVANLYPQPNWYSLDVSYE